MNNLTFKVQLTPLQNKKFQAAVFDKRGSWAEGETTVMNPNHPFMILRQGKMSSTADYNESFFRAFLAPEIGVEQAFKLVKNALPVEKPIRGGADEPTDQEEFHSGLTTFLKKLDEIYETILEMESKEKKEGK